MSKDIPPVEGRALQRIREELQILMGIRGDRMDAAMTLRGAISSGILVPGPGGVYFPGTSSEPDLTPPPDVAGLTVTAGFSQVLVQFTAPIYTQGHGNLRTNIYAVKKAPSDATLPTYSEGVTPLVSAAIGALNIVSIPSELNTRWHVWAKHETVDGVLSLNAAGGVNGYNVAGVYPTTGQDIAQLLEILTGEITESQLYNDLGDKIDIIGELQYGQAENAENTLRALVAVQDVSDGTYAAIAQEASVREDQTGALFAQWTVKLDVNGYVSGFGLASTSAGATPYSQFIVRADSFAVAAPSGPGVDPAVPFIVRTTSTTENGVTIPVGVYMDSAYIANVSAIYGRFGTLVADSIAAGQINAAHLTLGDGTVGGDLKSTAYTAGTGSTPGTGWKLTPSGNLYASNAVLYGTVYASAGELGTLNVAGGLTIGTTGHIKGGQTAYNTGTGYYIGYSGGAYKLSIGSTTSGLTWDGTALAINGGGTFSGALSAASGTFAGALSAATGSFGAMTIAAGGSLSVGQTAYNTGVGSWRGWVGGVYKESVGDPAGTHMLWDGTNLTINTAPFSPFTATIGVSSVDIGLSGSPESATVTLSGGTGPFTYLWILQRTSIETFRSPKIWISGGMLTATVSIRSSGDSHSAPPDFDQAMATVIVTDATGRVTVAAVPVTIEFTLW